MVAALIHFWARFYIDGEFWICLGIHLDVEGKTDRYQSGGRIGRRPLLLSVMTSSFRSWNSFEGRLVLKSVRASQQNFPPSSTFACPKLGYLANLLSGWPEALVIFLCREDPIVARGKVGRRELESCGVGTIDIFEVNKREFLIKNTLYGPSHLGMRARFMSGYWRECRLWNARSLISVWRNATFSLCWALCRMGIL